MSGCTFERGASSASQVADHLKRCDGDFSPPLSQRVDIEQYAQKIFGRAIRFEAWSEGVLVGLLAAYCDSDELRTAFITNVSVVPEWRGRQVANRLLSDALRYLRDTGIRRVELEVGAASTAALALYRRQGFVPASRTDEVIRMQCDL